VHRRKKVTRASVSEKTERCYFLLRKKKKKTTKLGSHDTVKLFGRVGVTVMAGKAGGGRIAGVNNARGRPAVGPRSDGHAGSDTVALRRER